MDSRAAIIWGHRVQPRFDHTETLWKITAFRKLWDESSVSGLLAPCPAADVAQIAECRSGLQFCLLTPTLGFFLSLFLCVMSYRAFTHKHMNE